MFAYLIIGIELIILYGVFWVVFLREPKRSEIRSDLWGNYSNADDEIPIARNPKFDQPTYLIDQDQLEFYLPRPANIVKPPAYRTTKISKLRRGHHLNHQSLRKNSYCTSCSCDCACHTSKGLSRKTRAGGRHWHNIKRTNIPKASRTIVEAFLVSLNHLLNQLSVKLP